MAKKISLDEYEMAEEMIESINACPSEGHKKDRLLELQLTMATTSINHEYAGMEFDETDDLERKEELLEYMAECRNKYLEAREELACYNPLKLEAFERDLAFQKKSTLVHYHA